MDIFEWLDKRTMEKGYELMISDAITNLDMDEETVEGDIEDHNSIYHTIVYLDDLPRSTCTCGKEGCEHMAALICTAAEDFSEDMAEEIVDHLDNDQVREILKFVLDEYPEAMNGVLENFFGMELADEYQEDDLEKEEFPYDKSLERRIQEIEDIFFIDQDENRSYEMLLSYIDQLDTSNKEEAIIDEYTHHALAFLILIHELSHDESLKEKIREWIKNNKQIYMKKYNIDLEELLKQSKENLSSLLEEEE